MTDSDVLALPLLAGRYRLGRLLGRGGMADVHAAVDEQTGALVAVKLFGDPMVPGQEGEVRQGEVRALEGLRHPCLVELLDVGEDGGRPFVVMTLVDAPTLADRISRGPLSREATARVGSDLATALAYVHDHGVVHRDVKPANVLLAGDGRARLADFGIARLVDATRVTRSGFTIGTAGYLAPEQVTGERITPAADVYALGLVLLECLTARREYEGPVIEAALARLHRPPQVPDDLPAGWRSLLQTLTADDPARRPPAATAASAAAVLAEQPDAPSAALRLDRAARQPGPRVVVPNSPIASAAAGSTASPAIPASAATPAPTATPKRTATAAPTALPPPVATTARAGGSRRVLMGAAVAAALLAGTGAVLWDRQTSEQEQAQAQAQAQAGTSAPSSTAPSSAAPPVLPEQALADAAAALEAAGPAGGGDASAVLARLRQVAELEGQAQANTAVALADDVRGAVQAGRLDAAAGERAAVALERVAAPEDLVGLVRLARHDPQALATDGAEFERQLIALDHETATADVPRTARRLLDRIEQGAATGRVSPAFRRIAEPVLAPLIEQRRLTELRVLADELGRDPEAAGELGPEVLERIEALLADDIYTRTLDARALVRDLYDATDEGELTPAFRDRAVPVLEGVTQRAPR